MSINDKLEMIKRIDSLVRRRATGTPSQLAEKLEISERSLFLTLKLMKQLGAPLKYCNFSRNYKYEYRVDFSFGFYYSPNHKKEL